MLFLIIFHILIVHIPIVSLKILKDFLVIQLRKFLVILFKLVFAHRLMKSFIHILNRVDKACARNLADGQTII